MHCLCFKKPGVNGSAVCTQGISLASQIKLHWHTQEFVPDTASKNTALLDPKQ